MSAALEQLLALPKCELHLHLEGVVSLETLWQLKQGHGLQLPGINSRDDLQRRMCVSSLAEFIDCFINVVQACFLQPQDLRLMLADLEAYLQRNTIRYAEVFFAPSKLVRSGIPYPDLALELQQGAERLAQRGFMVRYLIDVSRSFGVENAQHNLDLVLALPAARHHRYWSGRRTNAKDQPPCLRPYFNGR